MLFNESIYTLKKADNELTISQALSAASVILRDDIHGGRFKTPFQQLALSPSGRTPSVGARHMQRIANRSSLVRVEHVGSVSMPGCWDIGMLRSWQPREVHFGVVF
jgi:hypothetical protein